MAHDHDRFRVRPDKKFRLEDHDPGDTGRFESKEDGQRHLEKGLERLAGPPGACSTPRIEWAVLLIFQAMDAAGKDSVIEHVMSGVNPQGCQVFSFKAPSSEELDHDFLWRTTRCLPERGRIGVFNRSLLRGGPRGARAPADPARQKLPARAGDRPHLEGALRGHQRLRAPPGPERDRDPQVLPERLAGGAAQAVPGPPRRAGEELEVRGRRTSRSASTGTNT